MNWTTTKMDDRESDDRIEHESEEEREVKADLKILGAIQASEKNNMEVMTKPKKAKPKADKIGTAHV